MDFINKGSIFSLKEASQLLSNRSKGINPISAVQKKKRNQEEEEGVARWSSAASFPPRSSLTRSSRSRSRGTRGPAGSPGESKRFDCDGESGRHRDTKTPVLIKWVPVGGHIQPRPHHPQNKSEQQTFARRSALNHSF